MTSPAEHSRRMKKSAPIVCERAMGWWAGDSGCIGSACEVCGRGGWWYPLAHITEKSQGGGEEPENLLNACYPGCHDHVRYGDGGLACGTERAKQIAGGKE